MNLESMDELPASVKGSQNWVWPSQQRRPAFDPVSGEPVAGFPSSHTDAVGNWLPDLAKKGVFVQFSISVFCKNFPIQQYDTMRLPCPQPASQVTDPGGHPSQGHNSYYFSI